MDHVEAGRYWDENADAWTALVRKGYDVYRDYLNTPAFMAMLPDVTGLDGLDVGCGEGHNTRMVARRGAHITAIDVSPRFLEHAKRTEREEPLGISYQVASAVELPFEDERFDFATAFMCMMDIPDADKAITEVFRVIKRGGFFQFSITHPCFDTYHRRNLRDENGNTYAIEVGRYFDAPEKIAEWLFGSAPEDEKAGLNPFKVPCFYRPLSFWINSLADVGFRIERMNEPYADDATVRRCPAVQDTQVVGYFLHIRCRKPIVGK